MCLLPEGRAVTGLSFAFLWEQMEKQVLHLLGRAEWPTSTSADTPRVTPAKNQTSRGHNKNTFLPNTSHKNNSNDYFLLGTYLGPGIGLRT